MSSTSLTYTGVKHRPGQQSNGLRDTMEIWSRRLSLRSRSNLTDALSREVECDEDGSSGGTGSPLLKTWLLLCSNVEVGKGTSERNGLLKVHGTKRYIRRRVV